MTNEGYRSPTIAPPRHEVRARARRRRAAEQLVGEHAVGDDADTELARGQAAGRVDDTLPAAALATMLLAVLDGSKAIRLRDPAVDGGHAREMLLALVSRVLSNRATSPATSSATADDRPR
ncbi:hypothetical protein WMF27_26795 [Sorangium sp. So ce281]|uniref:hypothetical protein n=1 Tax=unclassified Sorangium TaxID=2621164 RepID=UPI003F645EE2